MIFTITYIYAGITAICNGINSMAIGPPFHDNPRNIIWIIFNGKNNHDKINPEKVLEKERK